MQKKIQLYAVEGSSYSGCEGWSTWIMENSITTDINKAKEFANKHSGTYHRTDVIKYKIIEIDE